MIRDAMTKTITDLYKIPAIELVPLLPSDREIKAVWVHQPKHDIDGNLLRIKSRICPQGFRFRDGIDFNQDEVASYAPHVQTLMIGFQFEVQRSMYTTHLDVTNCFQMYSVLPTTSLIIMDTPDGFHVPDGFCIRMINALQGSPQASRIWQDAAEAHLLTVLKFQQSIIDPSFYWRWNGECFSMIIRTTDDFRVSSDDPKIMESICSNLQQKWEMTVQENKSWNGMAVDHDRIKGTLYVSMKRDIETFLSTFGMRDCKPAKTPAAPNTKLLKPDPSTEINSVELAYPYREIVGGLLWFARTGRPDILYAVNQLTKFSHAWDKSHIEAAKLVMRYLKGTIDLRLTLRRSSDPYLLVYADSDFGSEPEQKNHPMCSTSGWAAYIHGIGLIYAGVNLEKTISLSTAEAEYKVIARACKFIVSVRQFYTEIGFPLVDSTTIFNDNQAAIAMSKQTFSSSATRHMKIKFHYIREKVADGTVTFAYIPTERMVADIFTKALSRILFERFRNMLLDGKDKDGVVL
jgi:hypothetical protein